MEYLSDNKLDILIKKIIKINKFKFLLRGIIKSLTFEEIYKIFDK